LTPQDISNIPVSLFDPHKKVQSMTIRSSTRHYAYVIALKSPLNFLRRLSLLIFALILLAGFSINALGQVAIPLSQLNSRLSKPIELNVKGIGLYDGQLFINTDLQGFWILSDDGTEVTKIGKAKGLVEGVIAVGDKLFVTSAFPDKVFAASGEKELWLVNKDGHAIQLKNVNGTIHSVEAVGDQFFVGTDHGMWVVSKDGEVAEKIEQVKGFTGAIESIDNRLFVITEDGLLILSKDGRQVKKVKEIEGNIYRIKRVDDDIFVSAFSGLWVVDKDGNHARQVEAIETSAHGINSIDGKIFVGTDDGLWILNKDDEQAEKVNGIEKIVAGIYEIGDRLVVEGSDGLWIVSRDGAHAQKVEGIKGHIEDVVVVGNYVYVNVMTGQAILHNVYRIDPKVNVKTELIPNGWWAGVIGYVLPSNWLPADKVRVAASYSDESGKDPYDKTIPKEFRFAKADGDAIPSDDKFSTAEQFSYEIGWGSNDVDYWVKDKWGNTFEQKATYRGVPSQYFFAGLLVILPAIFVLGCFGLAPKVGFCHSAIMNPWLRKYFSLGSVPLLLSVVPSLRRHLLRRYSASLNKDKEFNEWKNRFVCPDEEFQPENFGKKLEGERRVLLTGQSGIGKTSYFKRLTANYASHDKPSHPSKVFPVYIPLTNYGGISLEDLVYNQLFSYGKITDKELAPMFLEQGGLLIFLDGVNEVQNVSDRQKLSAFVEKFWASNYICLSSQQPYPEIDNLTKVELKPFSREKVCEFIRQRVSDQGVAEDVIKKLSDEDYKLYSIPRDLEFAVEILNGGAKSLPGSRTELYKTIFGSIFAKWKLDGASDAEDTLCKHAYTMVVQRDLAFDSVGDPRFKQITSDLFEQRFLVRREGSYYFRHELIRAFLASEYFYPRWETLFEEMTGKAIDSNWLEMLKFSCENIDDSAGVKSLVYVVLKRSVRKDLVKSLFEWLKANHPDKCKSWEADFYARYGELDFK
jgi:GTPase SAR1 family protein